MSNSSLPMDFPDLRPVRLADAWSQIRDADQLLFRRNGLIAAFGRSKYSHAAKAAWWEKQLMVIEVREWVGGRAVTLRSQVKLYPGRIDVFESNPDDRWPEYDRAGAMHYMRRLAGCSYGYWGITGVALLHLPFVRCFARPDFNDQANGRSPFCSHACALADRIGGHVDPVPHLADRYTEPGDLARSPFYRYRFTLIP